MPLSTKFGPGGSGVALTTQDEPPAARWSPDPGAAMLVGALYQLAADPEEWPAFIGRLSLETGVPDAHQPLLAAMVGGAEQVARSTAAQATAPGPAPPRLAVLAVRDNGRSVIGNAEAAGSLLAGLLPRPGEAPAPENIETLQAARARVRDGGGGPQLVRLTIVGLDQPAFAYAVRLDRLPAALREGLGPEGQAFGDGIAVIAHATRSEDPVGGSLADAFGLTPEEVRLAMGLCDGASLRAFADRAGLSVNTVRNQLNAIFDKVGVNRQTDLVRALTDLGQLWTQVGGEAKAVAQNPDFAPEVRIFHLPDGRNLAYRLYGPTDGRPVVAFHGGLGASLLPSGTDAACRDLGLRILAPDRAGVGRSDPVADPTLEGGARDMLAIAEGLGFVDALFVSITSGAHYARAAAMLAPRAAAGLLLLSPRPPQGSKPAANQSPMVALERRIRNHPWIAEAFFSIVRLRLTRGIMRQIMTASAVSPGDAAYLAANPQIIDALTAGMSEALAQGSRGTALELSQSQRLDDVRNQPDLPPVVAWHGAEDAYATPDEVRAWLGQALGEFRIVPDIGNYLCLKHWPEVLDRLARF